MKVTLSCPACRKQYQRSTEIFASGHFRCLCGEVLSATNAAKPDGATETLHTSASSSPCPACVGTQLASTRYGSLDLPALQCPSCTGLWLDTSTFSSAQEKAASFALRPADRKTSITQQVGPFYRRCPECSKPMNRRQFGAASGVVLDSCAAHGFWFDAGELEDILSWITAGGEARVVRDARLDAFDKERYASRAAERLAERRIERGSKSPPMTPLLPALKALFKGGK